MAAMKRKDYSKKAQGHHKLRGTVKNLKKGISPKSLNSNTMTPKESNSADRALGKLRGY